ncbi:MULTISPECIES: SH3 domain-containing protein [unclassified Streptomyces]|uniref:SH3 domain-containing protein n=1 Tax=unclassified Streptomyces TaxID=2593676 RepID=UPI002E2A13DD|nr:SH3 domain-containing protein [Streptomyces sp. NBC_00252]
MFGRLLRNGLVAAVAAVAVFPVTAVAATAAPASHHVTHHHAARHVVGQVTTRHYKRLNVRSGPGTGYRVVGSRPVGRTLPIVCKTYGSDVFGNHRWYKLPHHEGYVSAHYVHNRSAVRWC